MQCTCLIVMLFLLCIASGSLDPWTRLARAVLPLMPPPRLAL